MQWGRAFANLCYKQKVKLVNYPVGLKPIGPPGGISGSALIPLKYVKAIVKPHVQFWQQEAREKKAKAAKMREVQSLFDKDSPEEEEDQEQMVFEEDLVRFVPWDNGKPFPIPITFEIAES